MSAVLHWLDHRAAPIAIGFMLGSIFGMYIPVVYWRWAS